MDERGFALVELLMVVSIIGILAAIALPTFLIEHLDNSYVRACTMPNVGGCHAGGTW